MQQGYAACLSLSGRSLKPPAHLCNRKITCKEHLTVLYYVRGSRY